MVACAFASDDFQKRGRDRRTYQFDRSSTSISSACAPASASKSSSASVTVLTARCSRERIQRSRTWVGVAALPCAPSPGTHPSRFAYVVKNEYVFHSVRRNLRVASSTPSSDTRLVVHGDPEETMYQRSASAPRVSSTDHGSMMFPRDFDIFWPLPSTMCARHTTLRYGDFPNTSVLTASSE